MLRSGRRDLLHHAHRVPGPPRLHDLAIGESVHRVSREGDRIPRGRDARQFAPVRGLDGPVSQHLVAFGHYVMDGDDHIGISRQIVGDRLRERFVTTERHVRRVQVVDGLNLQHQYLCQTHLLKNKY